MGLRDLDRALQARGFGVVSRAHTPLAAHFTKLRTAFEEVAKWVNPRFRFVFIEDGKLNGVAFPDRSRSYVALTTGCVTMLETLFRLLLRSPHLVTHLSEPDEGAELDAYIKTTFQICVIGHDWVEVDDDYFSFVRKEATNAARVDLSYDLFKRALMFFYYHELAHLARGHGQLLQAAGGARVIMEAQGVTASDSAPVDGRQWAELEADWLAVVWLLQNEDWSGSRAATSERLVRLLFSIGVVFLIFTLSEVESKHPDVDHPPPALRLAHIFSNLEWFLVEGESYPFTSAGQIAACAQKALLEISTTASLAGFDWFSRLEAGALTATEQISAIKKRAGRNWIDRANRTMNRLIKHPPDM